MFKQFGAPELLLILLIVVLLFGAKRLPDAARGLGRSLRIFKAETKGLAGSTAADTEGPTPVAGPAEADTRTSDAPATEPTPGEQTPTQT